MNEFGRRVNSIIVKNLPTHFNENNLEELFSTFGRILSSKILPANPNFDGGCGFINYADTESCDKAVEQMNNFSIDKFILRVDHSTTRTNHNHNGFDRSRNGGCHINGETTDENNGLSTPPSGIPNRINSFRSSGARSSKTTSPSSNTNMSDTLINGNNKNSIENEITMKIREHDSFVVNKTYCVYLSNLEIPNVIFVATIDDYVHATLLITQMNKHEQLTKIQPNSYKSKLIVGQYCAALFNGDWYRACILEIKENRVHVQYVDWGNTGWCDSILEIRPLPNEFSKDQILCVKCILDGVPNVDKPSDEQMNVVLETLVLDVKLDMTVLHLENNIPYVQLKLGERNLNNELRSIFSKTSLSNHISSNSINEIIHFDSNKLELNLSENYSVQITTVDTEAECFHVLLLSDSLTTITNVLKDWNATKQPLTTQPKPNMLVCAQYQVDDLWYRAWIESVTEIGYRVYFVDFGNEEIVSIERLSQCPDNLRNIPWQSVQIKLANIKLTDDERYLVLKDFENDQINMKIHSKNQDIYSVELISKEKPLSEYIFELRQKNGKQSQIQSATTTNEITKKESVQQPLTKITTPSSSTMTVVNVSRALNESSDSTSNPVQSIVNEPKRSVETNNNKISTSSITLVTKSEPMKSSSIKEHNSFEENLITMITEQRRQNRLIEQVIAAINTTNALLTQLVQR